MAIGVSYQKQVAPLGAASVDREIYEHAGEIASIMRRWDDLTLSVADKYSDEVLLNFETHVDGVLDASAHTSLGRHLKAICGSWRQ
jgi:hypothetical protein